MMKLILAFVFEFGLCFVAEVPKNVHEAEAAEEEDPGSEVHEVPDDRAQLANVQKDQAMSRRTKAAREPRAEKAAPVPMPMNVAGQDMFKVTEQSAADREGEALRTEAQRALHRLLKHDAEHQLGRMASIARSIGELRGY